MRKYSATQPTSPEAKVRINNLTVVHSVAKPETVITKIISGPPALNPAPVYYSTSYCKDGPGGNYQGF